MPTTLLSHKNWTFQASTTPILASNQLDELTEQLGSSTLPEMIFNSKLMMRFDGVRNDSGDHDASSQMAPCCISFEAPHALQYAMKPVMHQYDSKISPVKVHFAWDKTVIHDRIMNEKKEIEERPDDMDWTFSTCYKGTCLRDVSLKEADEHDADAPAPVEPKPMRVFRETKRGIDYERLSQKDEILFYDDVILFEDELHDAGMCMLSVKVRVMQETVFCLLRYFLRVDNVMVRILDTRYYHVFGQNEVIREFSHRENTLEELRQKNPFLMRDPKLLDMPDKLQGFMDLKEKYNEVLYLDEDQIPREKESEEIKLPAVKLVRVTSRLISSEETSTDEETK